MDFDKLSKIKRDLPIFCPFFESNKSEIKRKMQANNISYGELCEALGGQYWESFLFGCIEGENRMNLSCLGTKINDAIEHIIAGRRLGL
jgi:hypothetical protein